MFESLSIQNFRLFRDFHIQNLARVNLIVGKNNAGKSSLLEGTYLLVNQGSLAALRQILEIRGEIRIQEEVSVQGINSTGVISRSDSILPRGYEIPHLFFGHQLKTDISIKLKSQGVRDLLLDISFKRERPNQLTLFGEPEAVSFLRFRYGGDLGRKIDIEVYGDLIEERGLRYSKLLEPVFNSNYITTKDVNYLLLAKLWDRVTLTPKEDDVIRMLQILEPDIERISFQSRQTATSGILIKNKLQTQPIPLGSMGDGIHHILAIAVALANSEGGYLFVDEIDTGLHYGAITDVWKLILKTAESLNVQVFATTHSWDCVRSFAEALQMQENKNIGALFRLDRMGEDIEAVKYTVEDLAFVMSQNIQNLEVR